MKFTTIFITLAVLSGLTHAGTADEFYESFKMEDTQLIKEKDVNQVKESKLKTSKFESVGIKLEFKLNGTVVFNHK